MATEWHPIDAADELVLLEQFGPNGTKRSTFDDVWAGNPDTDKNWGK